MTDDELLDDLIAIDHRQRSAAFTDYDRDFAARAARAAHAEITRLLTVLAQVVDLAGNSAWDELWDHLTHQGFGYEWAVEETAEGPR